MSPTPAELYWGILVSLFLVGGILAGACWVVWLVMSYRSQRRTEAFQEATLAHAKEAAERTFNLTLKLGEVEEVRRTVDEVREHIKEVLPLPPAPPTGTGWLIAPILLAAAAATSWAVYTSGVPMSSEREPTVVTQHKSAQSAKLLHEATLTHHSGDYKSAARQYEHALAGGADPRTCLLGLAECNLYSGSTIETEDWCQRLAVYDRGRACLIHGLLFKKRGMRVEATTQFEVAISAGEPRAVDELNAIRGVDELNAVRQGGGS